LKYCQPDIALLDENMNVFAVIEIVVTHYPEVNVLQYYRNNNIFLIQYKLYDEKELLEFENKVKRPDRVELCKSPRCTACGNPLQKKIMTIVNGPCWKCNSNMNIASISTSKRTIIRGISNFLAPGDFNMEEIKAARDNNVHLKHHYSKTAGYSYLANTCPKCNAFVGDHYVFTDYISQTGNDELFSYDVDLGYYCEYCNDRLYVGDDEY
jgi:predicted Zn-ribbon and HTH transcriptional regulator